MFKNKLLIVLFCICMIALMSTNAGAWPATTGTGAWNWSIGSIISTGLYKGCASNEDTRSHWVRVTVNLETNDDGDPNAVVTFLNPAYKPGGQGVAVPFSAVGTTSSTGETVPESLKGKGTCTSNITIEDDQLLLLLQDLLEDYLKNNWHVASVDILYFGGGVELYADPSDLCDLRYASAPYPEEGDPDCIPNPLGGDGYWERVIHAIFENCELRYDAYGDPESYDCTEPIVWEWDKKEPVSPYVFPWDEPDP
jgi:hypothetical protein